MRRLAVLLALPLALACGGESSTAPADPRAAVVGVYRLQTVNGQALPVTVSQTATVRTDMLGEQLSLNADGTCSTITSFRLSSGSTVTTTDRSLICTWTLGGTAVSIRFSDGTLTTGTTSANTVTVAGNGLSLVYRK